MSTSKVFSLALAAGLLVATVAAGTSSAAPFRGRRVYAYQPRAAAPAQARVQTNRRYSYSPAPSGGAMSVQRYGYRSGSSAVRSQGFHAAGWKVNGL
jgi:hypothetical protein